MIMQRDNRRISASDLMQHNLQKIAETEQSPFEAKFNYKPCRLDKTPIKGVNGFILKRASAVEGFNDNTWLTADEIKQLGYRIQKGAVPTKLSVNGSSAGGVYCKPLQTTDFYNYNQITGASLSYSRPSHRYINRVERYRKTNLILKKIGSEYHLNLTTKETDESCVDNIKTLLKRHKTFSALPAESKDRVLLIALHEVLTVVEMLTPKIEEAVGIIKEVMVKNPVVFVAEFGLAEKIAAPLIEDFKKHNQELYEQLSCVRNYEPKDWDAWREKISK